MLLDWLIYNYVQMVISTRVLPVLLETKILRLVTSCSIEFHLVLRFWQSAEDRNEAVLHHKDRHLTDWTVPQFKSLNLSEFLPVLKNFTKFQIFQIRHIHFHRISSKRRYYDEARRMEIKIYYTIQTVACLIDLWLNSECLIPLSFSSFS